MSNEITSAMFTRAQRQGINAERIYEFPDETLDFYEKTPTADNLLLTLEEDWCARRVSSNSIQQNEWEFEIMDTVSITTAVANKTVYMKIGDLKFKGVKRESTAGNLGVWTFITQMM